MVSEKKKREIVEIKELIKKYPVVGVLDLFKMPSRQLQFIRKVLRDNVLIKMCKKSVMGRALKDVKEKKNIERLDDFKPKEPALIFTATNPFKLFKMLKKSKSPGYAKANDIAPKDIVVHSGSTNLMAGPVIGELQRVKIPAMVKEGKIHIREDVIVVKKGEFISLQLANVLKKLEIQPMEIGINVLGVWDSGVLYGKDILDVDEEEYIQGIKNAYNHALNLCVNTCYLNKKSIKILIRKAYHNGKNLGINTEILDGGIIEDLSKKANVQARVLKDKLKI